MTGLYSPINKLMEQVTRPKGTGAEYMAELQKKPGYKPAEAEDRDLQTLMALPQMERAVFMEKLKGQKNKFPLKMREIGGTQTHHESRTLPGGENYREILLHTPMPEGKGFEGVPQHFGGAPNVIASVRVKDRTSPEGKKILHLEEIQSDWHQQGREGGYQPADLDKQIAEVAAWRKRLAHNGRMGGYHLDPEDRFEHDRAVAEAAGEHHELQRLKDTGVPRGPHAKDWHELALKAMIQHAAENGYDQIAITPGAEQAKRFGLSKHVGSVSYHPETQHFQAFKPNRETITSEKGATPERVKALIGKEATEKLLQAPKQMGHHYLEGEGLDMGGEGMKGFYDKMVPTFLNKFGKKHGVQVQPGAITVPEGIESGWATKIKPAYEAPVHTFDITPGMREDVLKNGIPRYADGGDVNDADRMTPRSRGRTSFGAAPRGNQIIKETGGNWIGGSIEEALKPLRKRTAGGMEPAEALAQMKKTYPAETTDPALAQRHAPIIQGLEHDLAVNNWIDRNLANYVKKQMATKEDPVRKLAEQGITHLPQDAINRGQWESDHLGKIRRSEGFPESGLATNEASRGWENLADEAIQITAPIVANKEMMEANPWLAKLPPNQSVYRARKADISELGFDHIVDVLKQDVAAGRIRPEQLNKISMEQAVRRAYEFDQEQAKKMRETAVKATEGMPVVKQYDTGHKWIELTTPKNMKLPEGYSVKPDPIRNQKTGAVDNNSYRLVNNEGKLVGWGQTEDEAVSAGLGEKVLKDALKYEGDTMGHCVGGYTPDVLEGKSRIYSLRDAKGEPHVTIETKPPEMRGGQSAEKWLSSPHRIVQIKGKQNRAPDKKYLPYVQDFVKGGQWSDVGDAKNAGLRKYGDVFNVNEQRQIEKTGEQVPEHEWLAGEDVQRLHNAITPPGKRLKYDANGNVTGNEGGYAKGGGVSRETAKRGVAHFSRGGSDVSPAVNLQMAREAAEREGQHEDPHTRSLQQGWEHGWYHGTTGDIHSFAPDYLGESTGAPSAKQGYFFARDPSTPPEHMMRHNPDSVNFLIKAGKQVPPNPTMAGNGPHTASSYAGTGGSREYKTAMRLAHAAEKKGDWDAHAKHMEDAENAEIKSMQYRQQLVASHGDARDNMYEQVKNAWYGAHNADKFKNMSQPAYKQYDDLYSELMPYGWHMKHSPEQFESVKQHIKQLGDNPQTKRAINAINHYLSVSHERKAADVESGANVIPAALRYSNPMYHDFEGKPYREQSYNDLIKEAKLKGHDALILKNTFDPGGSTSGSKMIDVGVMFHPKQIRSKFAAFHPDRVHEPDLLAAKGGVVKEKVTISPDMDVMQYELINRKAK